MNDHRNGTNNGDSLSTTCIDSGNFETGNYLLPTGLTNTSNQNFTLEAFTQAGCTGTAFFINGRSLSTSVAPNSTFYEATSGSQGFLAVNKDSFQIPPQVAGIAPSAGALSGGTTITITGADLDPTGTVLIGGSPCTSVTGTPTSLSCITGANTAGAFDVVVTSINGESVTLFSGYTYQAPPTVVSPSPAFGTTLGGDTVTITGSGFDVINGVSSVDIGGTACATFTLINNTTLTCTTSAMTQGLKDITVTNNDGDFQAGTLTNAFTANPPPTLGSLDIVAGPVGGGTTITITGTGFLNSPTIMVGAITCTNPIFNNSTSISCDTPANPAGNYIITVTNFDGQTVTGLNFTYDPPPSVGGITPIQGPTTGSTPVTITGTDFVAGATVTIGGVACTTVSVVGPTTLACNTGSSSSGLSDVVVTNPDGQSGTSISAYDYQTPALLTISDAPLYDFGTNAAGSTINYTFLITNSGDMPATAMSDPGSLVAPLSFLGGAYPGVGGTCGTTLAGAGATCTIIVNFSPTAAGLTTDTITINYNDGTGANTALGNIQGTGIAPPPMISTWRVGNGSFGDGDLTVTLPLRSAFNYNFTVDWGDGSSDTITTWNQVETTHTYATAGDYTITISGIAEAWYFNNGGDRNKIIDVADLGALGWINLRSAFYGCSNLVSFAGGDTSSVTDMGNMFQNATGITTLDLSSFDTSSVTNLDQMFYNASGLTTLDLSTFNTSSVTSMSGMFRSASGLTTLDLSGFDTSSVTTMSAMFLGTSGLTSLNLSSFDTSSVTTMSNMFNGASGLTTLDLSTFNTSSVTSMSGMFQSASGLTSLNLSSFNTTNVTSMSFMFVGVSGLTSLDLSSFVTTNVTDMGLMFQNASGLTSLDLSTFVTTNVTNMSRMFDGASGLTTLDLSTFDTSSVTNMFGMFESALGLASLDLSSFNTTNVTDMGFMFFGASGLTSLNLSTFDTTNVTSMYTMFAASGLTTLDLSTFDTSSVTNMSQMFMNATGLTSLDLSNFDTTNVTNMGSMFNNAPGLTTLDLSTFDTSIVTSMSGMFMNATGLTSLDLSSFVTTNVTDMSSMFQNASGLTSLNLSTFNTSSVTNMSRMFQASGLTSLDLSTFDTTNVTDMSLMFFNVLGLTTLDLSSFNTTNVTNMNSMFQGDTGLTSLDLTNWDTSLTPTYVNWLFPLSLFPILCNDPDGGGVGSPATGTVNGVACS